jgi:hypothetical protein
MKWSVARTGWLRINDRPHLSFSYLGPGFELVRIWPSLDEQAFTSTKSTRSGTPVWQGFISGSGYPETNRKKGCPDIAASNHFRYQQVGTSRVGADEKGENLG